MDHPARARVAEIMVARMGGTGEERTRGSGYLVSPGWVLTACHVVADAASVGVWLGAPPELVSQAGVAVEIGRVLTVPAADLALLPVGGPADDPLGEPVLFGRLDREPGPPVPVAAVGCPRFKLRPAPARPGVLLRELDYAIGSIAALSDAKTGRFAFAVDVPPGPDPEPGEHSPVGGNVRRARVGQRPADRHGRPAPPPGGTCHPHRLPRRAALRLRVRRSAGGLAHGPAAAACRRGGSVAGYPADCFQLPAISGFLTAESSPDVPSCVKAAGRFASVRRCRQSGVARQRERSSRSRSEPSASIRLRATPDGAATSSG
jgi:hypothetical protein